jgi:predicted glycosyltransferase involved in capsule biosynthesis
MLNSVSDAYVCVWDVDVIAHIPQVIESVELLRKNVDFVYPYEKYLLDTSDIIRNIYLQRKDINVLLNYEKFMSEMYSPNPIGGCFFANRESYLKSGSENERFYGWGVEDGERYMRWKNMGFNIQRVEGPLFHLTHPRGINSIILHPDHSIIKSREYIAAIRKSKKE